ncbi:hypothetical protein CkaCkLH20_12230 [Colletotrichum karsti]|uniref:Ankyrin repeat protein n=1 Tax=Colletotrichum karsti TaxID=1095194 RepID=A0A9P6HWJ9_9PEZI|nr:uncharacterized protein CkaCkLH20_12230 [Colletotrichum karsti]KAF9870266.1 hypothetical protein CkaCkLH20_12230 [Colletotrichum karsti]
MERLPFSLLVDIAIQLASITDNENNDFDVAVSGIRTLNTPSSPLRCLSKGRLSSLNAFSRSNRACYLACNPVLHETAVALDLVRFLVRKPYDDDEPVVDRADHSDAAAANPQAGKHVNLSQRGTFPPFEATELSIGQPNSEELHAPYRHEIKYQSDISLAAATASPLHAAACEGQDATVAWLLDRGANIEDIALHCCQCPSPHMRFLLKHSLPRDPAYEGALPTESTESYLRFYEAPAATPLSLALAYGRQSTAQLLILSGAVWDRPAPMSYGISPLHIMAAAGMIDLLHWIATRESESHPECATPTSAERHHDWPDDQGLCALHYSAVAGSRGLDIGDHASTTIFTETQAQDLVDTLLRLGSVASHPFEYIGELVVAEIRRVYKSFDLGEPLDSVATRAVISANTLLHDQLKIRSPLEYGDVTTVECKESNIMDLFVLVGAFVELVGRIRFPWATNYPSSKRRLATQKPIHPLREVGQLHQELRQFHHEHLRLKSELRFLMKPILDECVNESISNKSELDRLEPGLRRRIVNDIKSRLEEEMMTTLLIEDLTLLMA